MQSNPFPTFRSSPGAYAGGSPSLSTPTTSPMMVDAGHTIPHNAVPSESSSSSTFQAQNTLPPMISPSQSRHPSRPAASLPYRSPSTSSAGGQRPPNEMHPPQLPPPNGAYPNSASTIYPPGAQGTTLPPISSFQDISGRQVPPSNVSSVRYHHPGEGSITSPRQHALKPTSSLHVSSGHRSPKRKAAGSSNVTSSNNSDFEDDDNGELPSKGLVAPWEVLRGLADVAAERAAQVCIHFLLPLTLV